jgi:predicted dehydrogenase
MLLGKEPSVQRKLKVGVIGLGKQSLEDHIPGVQQSRFAELEAVCDPNTETLRKVEDELRVHAFSDHRSMFERSTLDFVIVATPHDQYRPILEEASARGVHILKEKPFALDLREARAFRDLAERCSVHMMTTLQRRFNPIYTTFFQLLDHIGDPFFLDIRYTIFTNSPHTGWRGRRAQAGGGCLIDMGYHMIDLLIWYFGLPRKVTAQLSASAVAGARYDAEDTASVMFSYDDGLYGSLLVSRFCGPKTEEFKVIGTHGIIELERGAIRRRHSSGELVENLTREKAWPSASAAQIDHFCRVIRGERENMGSPGHHLQHAAFIDACYESARTGTWVVPTTQSEERT